MIPKFLFTCEHAQPGIPTGWSTPEWLSQDALSSHRAWDPGAAELTHRLAHALEGEAFTFPITRLLIDANRNPVKALSIASKRRLSAAQLGELQDLYRNYRNTVQARIGQLIQEAPTHGEDLIRIISVHSFTPILNGKRRKTDVGLLFRTNHPDEASLAQNFRTHLYHEASAQPLKETVQALTATPGRIGVHFNLPYRGFTDCFINDLLDAKRREHRLTGLMLEVNQTLLSTAPSAHAISQWIARALRNLAVPAH
jgi:predicted N-formylglutamate amidohydrolase